MAGSVSPCPKLVNSSSRGGFCVTFEWLKSPYSVLNENNFQFGHTVYRCLALTNIVAYVHQEINDPKNHSKKKSEIICFVIVNFKIIC